MKREAQLGQRSNTNLLEGGRGIRSQIFVFLSLSSSRTNSALFQTIACVVRTNFKRFIAVGKWLTQQIDENVYRRAAVCTQPANLA